MSDDAPAPADLSSVEDPTELAAGIEAWLLDVMLPAPTYKQLARHVYAGDGDYPDEYLADIAVERSEELKTVRAKAEELARDVTRAGAIAAIDKIVELRNRAELQSRHLIRDLFQIAATLLCEPSQSGVINAILGLQGKVRELEAENEALNGEVDSLNDQLTDANERLESYGPEDVG